MRGSNKMTPERFLQLCKQIEVTTGYNPDEPVAEKYARVEKAKKDYSFFFEYYFPHFAKSKTAKFHIKLANDLKKDKSFRGIFEAFRGSAKSTHAGMGIPLWLLINGDLKCMVLVGQTDDKAKRLIASLQAQFMSNQRFIHDFGEQYSFGNWSDGEFITKGGAAFYSLGMGQSPRGTKNEENRPDFILCDDLDNKKLSKNPQLVREYCEWIEEDLMGCFDGTPDRFLLVNNRFSKNSILARLHKTMCLDREPKEQWWHMRIDALDKNGEPTWHEKYTRKYWEQKRSKMTRRAFEREYMNNPVEEGKDFKEQWIRYKEILPLKDYDLHVVYGDPSFKEDANSDFKAVKHWGSKKTELHMIDAWVRQCSPMEMVRYYYDHYERMPKNIVVYYFIEANMLQYQWEGFFYDEGLSRGYQLPNLRFDLRKKPNKYERIISMSPNYENGRVYWNLKKKHDPDFVEAYNQLIMIEPGYKSPDDSPDADEGAWEKIIAMVRARTFKPIIGMRESQYNW